MELLQKVIKRALEKLNEQFPGAQFKGQHGFVNGEEIEEVKMKIKAIQAALTVSRTRFTETRRIHL